MVCAQSGHTHFKISCTLWCRFAANAWAYAIVSKRMGTRDQFPPGTCLTSHRDLSRRDAAFYKLTNVHSQITSYVDDAVRSAVPLLTLDEAFESKDHVAESVKKGLQVSPPCLNKHARVHRHRAWLMADSF